MLDVLPEVTEVLTKATEDISSITGKNIKLKIVYEEPLKPEVNRDQILRQIICEVCEVEWSAVASKCRKREKVIARQLYCFFAKKLLTISLKSIGENIGGRDHTTAIHSIQTINNLLYTKDHAVCWKVEMIERKIKETIHEA